MSMNIEWEYHYNKMRQEVREEFLEEGIQKGAQNKALEIAKNLIRTLPNLSDSAVADIAELSLKTIRALREKLQ